MQEQMRQMQEDNEFRFQELEKTGNSAVMPDPAVTQPGIEQSSTASTTPGTQTPVRLRRIWAQSGSIRTGRPDRRHHRAASDGGRNRFAVFA
jgi:TolA-binding protein